MFLSKSTAELKRLLSPVMLITFIFSSCVFPARASAPMFTYENLPAPGNMIGKSGHFVPIMIKGLKIYGDDPLKFDFILDSGNEKVSERDFQQEGLKLAKYFLAGLTVQEKDLWVNLSPYEKDRIIPESFGQTLLGRDLLAQDYILKQFSSSLIYPEKDLGKTFWNQVYAKARELYGTTEIPVSTFNKVWIVPDKAMVWENNGMAFVTSSHLKVLSEEDYLSLSKNMSNQKLGMEQIPQADMKAISKTSAEIMRKLILPEIEKEVNEGWNFANLRQIYNAMILAVWYKQTLKESLLSKVYVNQNKTLGVNPQDKKSKVRIYNQYLTAFKKGVFNFIKEDVGENNTVTPRKYFSGGADWAAIAKIVDIRHGDLETLPAVDRAAVAGSVGNVRQLTWKAMDMGPQVDADHIRGALNKRTADGAMLSVRQGFTTPEGQRPEVFTNIYSSFQIISLLKRPLNQIPDDVIDAIKGYLQQEITNGHIKSFLVNDFQGSDVDIHVTHNFGPLNVSVHQVVLNAIKAGLIKAQEMELLNQDVNALALQKLAETLNVKSNEHTVTERGAESVVISRGINVGMGAANIKLFHLFAVPGSTPRQKLGLSKAPGVRFTVRRTKDILENNLNGPVWDFEISEARTDKQGKVWPSKNETTSLLALASQPNDYQIVAVYPVEGGALPSNEPLATVVYQPVYNKGKAAVSLNPTIIFRSQSGADAVGVIGTMMETPNFVPGGENGEHYVATSPLSLKEARQKISVTGGGIGYFTVYGYQSRNNGQIPPERMGIIDHVGVNSPGVEPERRLAVRLGEVMADHQWDQPGLTPAAAEAKVEHLRQQQNSLFVRAPKDGEEDTYLSKLENQVEQGSLITITDDKADMGGLLGHTAVPPFMTAVYRASMLEAVEQGRIVNGNTFGDIRTGRLENDENLGVGDDGHMIMLGDKSRFGQEAHKLAFRTFTRAYLFSSANGMKPYGEGQDYQGAEAKVAKQKPYAYSEFSERFFELLRQAMPNDYMWMIDPIYTGWKDWQTNGQSSQTLTEPFNGNVSAQGIGSARYFLNPKTEKNFIVVAGDKMGPPALNRPIREGVYAALTSGAFKNGLVFEIWDAKAFNEQGDIAAEDLPVSKEEVKTLNIKSGEDKQFVDTAYQDGHLNLNLSADEKNRLSKILKASGFVPAKRIFLDAQADRDAILRYLADSDRFNIKHVWGKTESGWDISNPQQYLDRPVLASSITRLGILTGGEYVGKDDPVMVGHTDLMTHIVEFFKTRPLIVQGDMNGSHWLQSIPTALRNAVATKDSHPIMVALKYDLSDDGTQVTKVEDLTGKTDFDEVRFKALEWNRELRTAQLGQFEPLGTNARTVEGSYELAKILRDLNRADSPFLRSNKQKQEPERFVAQLPSDHMGEVYQSVDHAALAVIPQQRNVSSTDPLGGIDLRPEWFDLQIKRNGKGVPLPVSQQPIGTMKIQGFMPVSIQFKPITMPDFLKVGSTKTAEPQLAKI